MKKVIVLVPHHDDEVLGFGGTIAKHVESGDFVHVCFLKKPSDARTRKQFKDAYVAQKILGYQQLTNLKLSEDELNVFSLDALRKVELFLIKNFCDILYIPHVADGHQEHHMTIEMARIATRIWGPNKIPLILSGEILSSSSNTFHSNFNPNYYICLKEEHIVKKINALLEYKNETRPYPHARSVEAIEVYAMKRGIECHCDYAETFEVLRQIVC